MYTKQWRNAAAISNEGLEILVKADIISKPVYTGECLRIGAKNWNRFRKSYSGFDENGWIIGKPLNGVYKALQTEGYVNKQDELPVEYSNSEGWEKLYLWFKSYLLLYGRWKYIDVNGDGIVDYNDEVYVGKCITFL